MLEVVEISSAEESISDDESEGEVVVQELAVTCTTRKVTQKITKKPPSKPTTEDRILAALSTLQAQYQELSERLPASQEVSDGFVDIDSIDITGNSPQKQPRAKRKGVQRKQPSLHASNSSKKPKK